MGAGFRNPGAGPMTLYRFICLMAGEAADFNFIALAVLTTVHHSLGRIFTLYDSPLWEQTLWFRRLTHLLRVCNVRSGGDRALLIIVSSRHLGELGFVTDLFAL